jgi:NodT family efflux transporter outer membrane factor (OMF) lipoprotein
VAVLNRQILAGLTLLLAGLALTSCSLPRTAGGQLPFVDVPTRWDGAPVEQATGLSQWWLRFYDPMLATLVNEALRANPSIAAARAALRQSRAMRDVSGSALYPALGASISAQESHVDDVSRNTFQAGLDANWELDIFGANRSAVSASEASAQASAASLGDVQVSVAAEVALDYIALRSAQERMEIADTNLAIALDSLQVTQWRQQAGLATSLETEQARSALEQTRASIPSLQLAIAQGSHALAVLTGRTPQALGADLAGKSQVPQPATDIALSFPADTLRQRADVRAAEFQVNAASALALQADAARLPALRLSGTLGLNALTLAGLSDGASVLGTLLASLTVPIFDGGAGSARQRSQQAALEQVQASYRASVLNALREVEDALVALRSDRLRLDSLRLAAESALSASLMASQSFQIGLVDFRTVLDTQRARLATQDSVASAYASVSSDHVRLYKALGGGWQSDSGRQAL